MRSPRTSPPSHDRRRRCLSDRLISTRIPSSSVSIARTYPGAKVPLHHGQQSHRKRIPVAAVPQAAATSAIPAAEPQTAMSPQTKLRRATRDLRAAAKANDVRAAEEIQTAILGSEHDPNDKAMIEIWLLGERARHGDSTALAALKARCSTDPLNFDVLTQLFEAT